MEFSVLITVYKKEIPENLRKSILSCYQQTIKPKEIILICDGELTAALNEEINLLKKDIPVLLVYQLPENLG